jgi:hypothetical protein
MIATWHLRLDAFASLTLADWSRACCLLCHIRGITLRCLGWNPDLRALRVQESKSQRGSKVLAKDDTESSLDGSNDPKRKVGA